MYCVTFFYADSMRVLCVSPQRFSRHFASSTLEREGERESGEGFSGPVDRVDLFVSSVEGFNFPGTTKSVFLFRRFSHQRRRHPKEGEFQHPDKVDVSMRFPSHTFVLRFFFPRCLSVIYFLFSFFVTPTRLSGAVWMGDRFEAIRLFRRNEFTLPPPKKRWVRWRKRRSMAYCAVSHVVWLRKRGWERKYGRGGLIHLALSLFNICSRLTGQLVLYPFSDASREYWNAPVCGVRDKYRCYLIW